MNSVITNKESLISNDMTHSEKIKTQNDRKRGKKTACLLSYTSSLTNTDTKAL